MTHSEARLCTFSSVISPIRVMDREGILKGNTNDRETASPIKATDKCQPQERVRMERKQRVGERPRFPERRCLAV